MLPLFHLRRKLIGQRIFYLVRYQPWGKIQTSGQCRVLDKSLVHITKPAHNKRTPKQLASLFNLQLPQAAFSYWKCWWQLKGASRNQNMDRQKL